VRVDAFVFTANSFSILLVILALLSGSFAVLVWRGGGRVRVLGVFRPWQWLVRHVAADGVCRHRRGAM